MGAVVSLSPAATDLLLAMGAADRLAGVSTYDSEPRVSTLPRVGDYENVDWERIATLAPKHMIVQMAADRVPTGFRERAARLGITVHVVQIDRLQDILNQCGEIASAVGCAEQGEKLRTSLGQRLLIVKASVAGKPRLRTLLVTNADGLGVAGRETYLDDLLTAAGGANVVTARGYVKLDREALLALSPDAIVRLAPSPTAAQREAMKAAWENLADLPAVKKGRVLTIQEPWALMPGAHVGELAARFARFLHP